MVDTELVLLAEDPPSILDDINAIRAWMEKEPHLIGRKDDQFIATFLRCCKYSLEETKKRIEAYLSCKSLYPEYLKNRQISDDILKLHRAGLYIIPPNIKKGPRLLIMQLANCDMKVHHFDSMFKLQFMMYDLLAFEDNYSSINGIETVFDLKNCTFNQVLHFDFVSLKKIYIYMDQCMPMKQVRAHVINLNKDFYGFFKFARNILPAKMPLEIIVHEKAENMFEYFSREVIISEYGGSNGTKEDCIKEWDTILQEHTAFFEEDATYGTDEKLRQGQMVSIQTDFGVEGSFRKLEVD